MTKTFFPFEINEIKDAGVIRQAYKTIRKAANQRLSRMEKAGLGTKGSYRFPKVKDLTDEQMRKELLEASRYMRDPRHTVPGERKFMRTVIEALHEKGVDEINESNFYEYTEFMDAIVEQYGAKAYDSGDVNDVWNNAQRIGIDPKLLKENIDYFLENKRQLEKMKPIRSSSGADMTAMSRKIKKLGGMGIAEYRNKFES